MTGGIVFKIFIQVKEMASFVIIFRFIDALNVFFRENIDFLCLTCVCRILQDGRTAGHNDYCNGWFNNSLLFM